jgi:histidinol-phosphate aminotransferase
MHFGVNSIAQAGALASLKDTEFVVSVVQETAKGRNEMVDYFGGQGFHVLPSSTNFLTVDVGDRLLAEQLVETLLQAGVFIRKPSQPPLEGCIRVTIGHTEQRQLFYERFESSLKAIKGSR